MKNMFKFINNIIIILNNIDKRLYTCILPIVVTMSLFAGIFELLFPVHYISLFFVLCVCSYLPHVITRLRLSMSTILGHKYFKF